MLGGAVNAPDRARAGEMRSVKTVGKQWRHGPPRLLRLRLRQTGGSGLAGTGAGAVESWGDAALARSQTILPLDSAGPPQPTSSSSVAMSRGLGRRRPIAHQALWFGCRRTFRWPELSRLGPTRARGSQSHATGPRSERRSHAQMNETRHQPRWMAALAPFSWLCIARNLAAALAARQHAPEPAALNSAEVFCLADQTK